MTNYFNPKYDAVFNALMHSACKPQHSNPLGNALSDLYSPPGNSLGYLEKQPSIFGNALSYDHRLKTEYVPGYNRTVPNGLLGYRQEWVPGYWRREG